MIVTYTEIIGWVAALVTLTGFIPYIISILRGDTIPNRASWWIWTIIGTILCSAYYFASDSLSSFWVPLSYTIGPLVVAILSFKYGEGGLEGLDLFCLIGSLFSLILWFLSKSALLALGYMIIIDIFAGLPTLRKAYLKPFTENLMAWVLFSVGSTMNLFAISHWDYASSIYPLYLSAIAVVITLILFYRRKSSCA